tara:strand:+ start:1670 stop:1852 length:183 start_codon:yes stop_codon:yes gene_type:complete
MSIESNIFQFATELNERTAKRIRAEISVNKQVREKIQEMNEQEAIARQMDLAKKKGEFIL